MLVAQLQQEALLVLMSLTLLALIQLVLHHQLQITNSSET
jgi:hypothetical protein